MGNPHYTSLLIPRKWIPFSVWVILEVARTMKKNFSQAVYCNWTEILICTHVLVKSYSNFRIEKPVKTCMLLVNSYPKSSFLLKRWFITKGRKYTEGIQFAILLKEILHAKITVILDTNFYFKMFFLVWFIELCSMSTSYSVYWTISMFSSLNF